MVKSYLSRLSSRVSEVELSDDQKRILNQVGRILDSTEVGEYQMVLTDTNLPLFIMKYIPSKQIGFQKKGYEFTNLNDQADYEKAKPESPKLVLAHMKTVISSWLNKYGDISFASHNQETQKKWTRILKVLGFRVDEINVPNFREIMVIRK